jgi:hypothetical protein
MRIGLIAVACLGCFAAPELGNGNAECRSSPVQGEPVTSNAVNTLRELLARKQPDVEGLVSWGGKVLVLTKPPSLLDVNNGVAAPLDLPEGLKFVFPAQQGEVPVALFSSPDGGLQVLERTRELWKDRGLPTTSYEPETSSAVLAANSKMIVVLASSLLRRFENGIWTTIAVGRIGHERDGILFSAPRHALIQGRLLYLGCDDGEWGGDLVALNVDTGEMVEVMPGMEGEEEMPVRCLEFDRHGILWCVRGLAHMGGRRGSIYRRAGDRWSLIASCQSDGYEEDDERGGDWNLIGTSFDAVAFDGTDEALLLTERLGLVHHHTGVGWTRLTLDWPDDVYTNGLLIEGRTAVISTCDSGVVLLNLDDGSSRRVALPH